MITPTLYSLAEQYIGGTRVNISEDRYREILKHQKGVVALKRINSLYSLTCRSFIELELLLAEAGIEFWVGSHDDAEMLIFFEEFKITCSLKTLNLLNAHTAYLDQVPQLLKDIQTFIPDIINSFKLQCSDQYDNNLDYRLFSCLRNFSQHHQLPIEAFSVGPKTIWEKGDRSPETRSRTITTLDPSFLVETLLDSNLKAKDRVALEHLGLSKLDLKSTVRSFVASFGKLQEWLISKTKPIYDEAEIVYIEAYERVSEQKNAAAHFVALTLENNGKVESANIKLTTPSKLKSDQCRWNGMTQVVNGAVSGEVVRSRDTYYGGPASLLIE